MRLIDRQKDTTMRGYLQSAGWTVRIREGRYLVYNGELLMGSFKDGEVEGEKLIEVWKKIKKNRRFSFKFYGLGENRRF